MNIKNKVLANNKKVKIVLEKRTKSMVSKGFVYEGIVIHKKNNKKNQWNVYAKNIPHLKRIMKKIERWD